VVLKENPRPIVENQPFKKNKPKELSPLHRLNFFSESFFPAVLRLFVVLVFV